MRTTRARPARRGGVDRLALGAVMSFGIAIILLVRFASPFASGSGEPSSGGGASCPPSNPDCRSAQQELPAFAVAPPATTAKSVVVMEGDCGIVLHGQDQHLRLPPASLTKIMTAIVAAERAGIATQVRVDIDGGELSFLTDSTVMGLKPGTQISMQDLLYGLLLPSGGDAALAIAEQIGGDVAGFSTLMNDKAEDLGLQNTHFTNPHGLDDPGLYSSAYDLAILGRELMSNPNLADMVKKVSWQPKWDGPPVWNGNALLDNYPGLDGIKIGFTEKAWQTMVATAQRNGWRVYVVVLGSSDRYTDVSRLLDWGFQTLAQPDVQAALKAKGCGP